MKQTFYQPYDNLEKSVLLKLHSYFNGTVALVAVEKDGTILKNGYILTINSSGMITRNSDVSDQLGFVLDNEGRITISGGD